MLIFLGVNGPGANISHGVMLILLGDIDTFTHGTMLIWIGVNNLGFSNYLLQYGVIYINKHAYEVTLYQHRKLMNFYGGGEILAKEKSIFS